MRKSEPRSVPGGAHDSLGTPEDHLRRVRSIAPIALDPCSNREAIARVRASRAICLPDDGIARAWSELTEVGDLIWVNPPYSSPRPWVDRAIDAAESGRPVLMLLKLDPTTKWAHRVYEHGSGYECRPLRRISFIGGAHRTGMFASWYVLLLPRSWGVIRVSEWGGTFREAFGDLGPITNLVEARKAIASLQVSKEKEGKK